MPVFDSLIYLTEAHGYQNSPIKISTFAPITVPVLSPVDGYIKTKEQAIVRPSLIFDPPVISAPVAGSIPISTFEDLAGVSRWDSYHLTKDIVIPIDAYMYGFDFDGIPEFSSTFDGQGHAIYGLRISPSIISHTGGLFNRLFPGAIVKNLTLIDPILYSVWETSGILCGRSTQAFIHNCHIKNGHIITITGSYHADRPVGGLVGELIGSQLQFCSCEISVDISRSTFGGIAGICAGSIITGCSASINGLARVETKERQLPEEVSSFGGIVGTCCPVEINSPPTSIPQIRTCSSKIRITVPSPEGLYLRYGICFGGIAGSVIDQAVLEDLTVDGRLYFEPRAVSGYSGGIVGDLNLSKIEDIGKPTINRCFSFFSCNLEEQTPQHGPVFGSMSQEGWGEDIVISNCYFLAHLYPRTQTWHSYDKIWRQPGEKMSNTITIPAAINESQLLDSSLFRDWEIDKNSMNWKYPWQNPHMEITINKRRIAR